MYKKIQIMLLSFLLALTGLGGFLGTASAAVSDYVSVTKSVNPTSITTEGEAEVTLNIKGTPPANVIMPNDVILIIDKSGSMLNDNRIAAAKSAAQGFIDLMDMSKHQVGIVDYSSEDVTKTYPLTTDKEAAKNYIGQITANGSTATGYAIDQAITLLSNHRPDAQPVIVIMTDGDATVGKDNISPYQYAINKAQEAKDAGIIFYTIALLGPNDDPDNSGPNALLKQMATTDAHHHFVLGSTGLADIYAAIVREIGVASAYNVVVSDNVSPDFEIIPDSYNNNIPQPTVSGNTLTWNFLELKNNDLVFKYKIRPKNQSKWGALPVSTTGSVITYKDYAGASRSKAIPSVPLTVKLPAPFITSIVEDKGHPLGGETITINGGKFRPNATVMMGNYSVSNVQFVNENQLVITALPGKQGQITIKVTNDDGQFATGEYTYLANPEVSSYTPNSGPYEGGTLVYFYGNYFLSGMKVKFGDNYSTNVRFYNVGYATAITPPATVSGNVDITLENPDGTKLVIPGGFTYADKIVPKLTITSISPNIGKMAGGEIIYIDGEKFDPSAKIYFGSNEANINAYYSDKRIRVFAPASTISGVVDVKVTNPDGETFTVAGGYTYEAPPALPDPTIIAITPNSGQLAGGELIYIDGTGLQQGVKVYFGNKEIPVNKYYSASRIRVLAPSSQTPGSVDVKVINPDNKEAEVAGGYTYLAPPVPNPPAITSVSPNAGLATGGTLVYIDGSDIQPGATVKFGEKSVAISNYYNSSRIRVTTPSSDGYLGSVDVTLINPDGQESVLSSAFTYEEAKPTIIGISPNNGALKGGELVYVDGTNFDPSMTLTVDGVEVPINVYYNNTRFRFVAPARSTAGTVPVVITVPTGSSASTSYTYNAPPVVPAPKITAITPAAGPLSGGTIVYIDGSGFDANSVVQIGTKQVALNRFYSAIRIRIIVPAGTTLGPNDLKVINPDGQESNSLVYEYK